MATESRLHRSQIQPLENVADGGCVGARLHFSEKATFSLRRWTAMKMTMSGERLRSTPRYELQPLTMARMENSST